MIPKPGNEETIPVNKGTIVDEADYALQNVSDPQQADRASVEISQTRIQEIIEVVKRAQLSTIYKLVYAVMEVTLFAVGVGIIPEQCSKTYFGIFFKLCLASFCGSAFCSAFYLYVVTKDLKQINTKREISRLPYPLFSFLSTDYYNDGIRQRYMIINLTLSILIINELALFGFGNFVIYSNLYSICAIGGSGNDYVWAISFIYLIPRYFTLGIAIIVLSLLIICFPFCYHYVLKGSEEEDQQRVEVNLNLNQAYMRQTKQGKVQGKITQQNKCLICFSTFMDQQEYSQLPCFPEHAFHKNCIQIWLSKEYGCPLCGREIKVKTARNLSQRNL